MLEVTAYTGLGEGPHDINVTDLKELTAKAGGTYLRWEFTDAAGKTASANSSVEMTPGNKTGKWFAALTGRPTVIGESRAMSEVIGKPGSIFIEINPEGYPKVVSLVARKAKATAHPPVAKTVAEDEGVYGLPSELNHTEVIGSPGSEYLNTHKEPTELP